MQAFSLPPFRVLGELELNKVALQSFSGIEQRRSVNNSGPN